VSATNVDLPGAIAAGRFREDLYFRLNVIELRVPPLADRVDDILPLVEHILKAHSAVGAPYQLSDEATRALLHHEWPGNVRELENRLQRATLVCKDKLIVAADLGLPLPSPAPADAIQPTAATAGDAPLDPERRSVEDALVQAGGIVSKAAAQMGLSRQALYRRMERLGLVLERKLRR
jgi:DNA-binding NtrC family response regulator